MDRDIDSVRQLIGTVTTSMQDKLQALKDLSGQAQDANDRAIQAALAGVNMTGDRVEKGFVRQIEQLSTTATTATAAMTQRIDDLRNNMASAEGSKRGSSEVLGWIVGPAAGAVIALVVGAFIHSTH
jgi:hypothetical protein